jgi:hypothetical protein
MAHIEYGNPGIAGVKSIQYLGEDMAPSRPLWPWLLGAAVVWYLWR